MENSIIYIWKSDTDFLLWLNEISYVIWENCPQYFKCKIYSIPYFMAEDLPSKSLCLNKENFIAQANSLYATENSMLIVIKLMPVLQMLNTQYSIFLEWMSAHRFSNEKYIKNPTTHVENPWLSFDMWNRGFHILYIHITFIIS